MVLLAAGSPLVAGSSETTMQKTKRVRVLRAFLIHGKPTRVGDVLELPAVFASELAAGNKAEVLADPIEPAKSEPKGKGAKDAGQ